MNLLHASATYWPFIGGAETYLRVVSERLVHDGHNVTVATTDAGEVEAFWNPRKIHLERQTDLHNGVAVCRARIHHTLLSPLSFYVYRRAAVELSNLPGSRFLLHSTAHLMPWVPGYSQLLEQLPGPFDLVHGVNIALEWPLIAAWRFARRNALPFVATPFVHTGEPGSRYVIRNYTMPHQLEALRDAGAVVVQTETERDCLARFGVDPHKLHVLGMGVDLAACDGGDRARFRARHALDRPDEPVVLFMGVLTKDKGVIHLVEAMRALWARGIVARLVLAGESVQEFEDYWKTLPDAVTRLVLRTGVISGKEKWDAFAAADVFALPSRVDSFGIVLLEAWACQLPVIGASAGGIPGVIDDGRDGLLVGYGDVPAMVDVLHRLLGDESLRRSLGIAGRKKVAARYTWDLIYRKLQQVYSDVLAIQGRGHHA